jgi:hypothetical protein
MAKDDNILISEIYPLIEKGLNKKENNEKLKLSVSEFLDRNNEKLTTIGPIYRIVFSYDDIDKLYECIEVNPELIKQAIKKSPAIKNQWQIMNNPFNSASALIVRYYIIHKNEEMANIMLIYLTMSMYPSLHSKYFEFEPNEQVMNYTINNLSNKFKIKQTGTIYHALIETTKGAYTLHYEDLMRGNDKDIIDFIMAVKTRLNSLLRHISNEFYRNKQDNLYLNTDNDNYDENNFHEADSNIYAIDRVTNAVVLKLLVNGPNIKLVTLAANWNHVSVNELRNYVNSMLVSENREKIKSVVESILFLYLFDSQNTIQDINSGKFINYCLEVYKKSNTTDKNILK